MTTKNIVPRGNLEGNLGTEQKRWSGAFVGNLDVSGNTKLTFENGTITDIATQAEAEAGTDNTKVMTPLRTAQEIDSKRPLKTFTSLAQIGISIGAETMDGIMEALPDNARLTYVVNTSSADIYPTRYETIDVVKLNRSRIYAICVDVVGGIYLGNYYQGTFQGWKQLATLDDFAPSVSQRNGYCRRKNLGTIASVADADAFNTAHGLSVGTFDDIFVGDEITIKDGTYNAVWLVAGVDWDYNKGDTASGRGIMLIPKIPLYNDVMNDTNTTEGGYKGSKMHTTILPALVTKLQAVLGSHLKKRRVLLTNAINTSISCGGLGSWTGASSGWEWADVYAVLPSENEIYGSPIWSSSGYDAGEANQKLPIFNFINPVQFSRWVFWLRSVGHSTSFCLVNSHGDASYGGASNSCGVRPLIYLA